MSNHSLLILAGTIIIVGMICGAHVDGLEVKAGVRPLQDKIEEYRLSVVCSEQHIKMQDQIISELTFELNECLKTN